MFIVNPFDRRAMTRVSLHRWRLTPLAVLLCVLLLGGCASGGGGFELKDLAKSDIDLVADAHRHESQALLDDLLVKLYRRNPRELRKEAGASIALRQKQFRSRQFQDYSLRPLDGTRGIEAIRRAFAKDYDGDRVFALVLGMTDMLDESYGGKAEFFMFDELDQQKLYNSARNLEVVAWLLRSRLDGQGQPMVLSNNLSHESVNLSFERLLGKLIANQDMMARVVAGKTQRAINTVAHSVVSMTLVPL